MNELRREPLLGRWVAISKMLLKPEDYLFVERSQQGGDCYYCSNEGENLSDEIYTLSGDSVESTVRVLQNTKSSFSFEGELGRRAIGMYDRMNSFGVSELVIESSRHETPAEELGTGQMLRVLKAFLFRMRELEKDNRIKYVMIHKDYGIFSGNSSSHPHSLITATPVIPMRIKAELDGAKDYYEYKERCIFCDIIHEEERVKERIIMESVHFFVCTPYAPRFPFESWILPRKHNCSFKDILDNELKDLSEVFTVMLRKLRRLLKNPPYNYVLHTAPNRIPRRNYWHTLGEDFHWHIELFPRVKIMSGFELGSGMYILNTSPEDAAKYFKEVPNED